MLQGTLLPAQRAASTDDIRHNLARVQAQIEQTCRRCGRDPQSVRLLPVSKTVQAEVLRLACDAGLTTLAENKVQEGWQKAQALAAQTPLRWVMIGHLQRNKARLVARFASEFQALDSLRLAAALDHELSRAGRTLDVLVQVNTSQESSKYGVPPEQLKHLLIALQPFSTLRVRGLMTLAALSSDQQRVRQCFRLLRQLREQMQQELAGGEQLQELSMGMSSDFIPAIEEGATTVRVGQAIFGPRPLPDSHYWPGL